MFYCTTLILKCIIQYIFLKSFLKSGCALLSMICNCLIGNINFSEVHKNDAFCNDMLDSIGDIYTILDHWYHSLTNIWLHLEFSINVKLLVLGTEVGPEISNSDVQVSRLGENGWRASGSSCTGSDSRVERNSLMPHVSASSLCFWFAM